MRAQEQKASLWPPHPVGSRSTQSLGRWIDNLLGDRRFRKRARRKSEQLRRRLESIQNSQDI